MPASDRARQLRKGVLELAILAVLNREECYSIEIINRLDAYPALAATPGTVYPLLARLDKAGLVATRWAEAAGGPPRKYYRLTRKGRASLTQGVVEWSALSNAVAEVLGEGAS
ncbi:MAG: PadR family transcriptional regulator [Propionibacteriaceae bacterium]|nr:PadR family transcriptional regulator [Propionibacteriaceae bacterium]